MRTRNWLRINRELHNLTRKELANSCGVSYAAIQAIEQGTNGGTKKTWETLECFFMNTYNFSVDVDSIVYDIKNWIKLRTKNTMVYVSYVMTNENHFLFYDWSFKEPELKYIKIPLGEALKLFKEQNKEV